MDDKDNDAFIISGNNDIVLGIDDLGVASGFTLDEITSVDIGNLDWINTNMNTTITTGSDTLTWSDSYNTWRDPSVNVGQDGIEIKGEGDLKIGDRSMKEFMDKVEELRRQYEECKQDILEKEKIMKILKED
jgi:hypothetical protein